MQNGRAVEVIKSRRSIRSYLDIQIPDSDLNSILEAGLYAPSGKNRQPWRFLIIKDKNKIRQISKFTAYSRFMHNAPVLVLVYLASSGDYSIEKDALSIGACMQNILLAAAEKGYGSCVIGERYSLKLEIENMNHMEYKLICGICIGKSKEKEYGVEFKESQHFLLGVL